MYVINKMIKHKFQIFANYIFNFIKRLYNSEHKDY